MPIFEYRCLDCTAELEAIVLSGEAPPDRCETCGGRLQRLWSRVGVKLVGWGFARNDALLPTDRPRKPFRQVSEKAAELFD